MTAPGLLEAADSALVVIDVQAAFARKLAPDDARQRLNGPTAHPVR